MDMNLLQLGCRTLKVNKLILPSRSPSVARAPTRRMSLSEFHLTPFLEFVLTCTHVAFPAFICFNHSSCSENSVARQILEFPPNVIPWPPGSAYHHLPGSTARTPNPAILPHSPFYSTAPLTNHMAYLLIMLFV